jgi:hypothetical protein
MPICGKKIVQLKVTGRRRIQWRWVSTLPFIRGNDTNNPTFGSHPPPAKRGDSTNLLSSAKGTLINASGRLAQAAAGEVILKVYKMDKNSPVVRGMMLWNLILCFKPRAVYGVPKATIKTRSVFLPFPPLAENPTHPLCRWWLTPAHIIHY